jgi:Carboxypeptidase regulatory-like domain
MKLNKFLQWGTLALACATPVTRLHGQSSTDGAIGGTVEDTTGAAIPNATVVIHSNTTNSEQTVTTDTSGFFRVVHLEPTTYTVTVSASGFGNYKSNEVIVQVGLLTDVTPKLATGSAASETVEVTADSPAINSTTPDFTGIIDQKTLQDQPVSNYRWSSYAALTPGVVVEHAAVGEPDLLPMLLRACLETTTITFQQLTEKA